VESIKIRYSKSETGWASKSEDGYIVDNVPLTDGLNIGDLVEIAENEDDFPVINKIIKFRFNNKAAIEYQEIIDYRQIKKEIEDNGGKVEGFFAPSVRDGKYNKGLAMIACDQSKKEIKTILKKYGAKIINFESRS